MIKEKIENLKSGRLTPTENIRQFLDKIKKENKKINAFLELNEAALQQAKAIEGKKDKGKLYGLAIGVKANICVQGLTASCASRTLKAYRSPYDADVIKRIKEEDGIIIGVLNCDEFACGVSGQTSAFGPTLNPVAPDHVPGGSSSGSAAAVAAGLCDLALGSDTGGSIRNPASHCKVVGIKPTYGRVSRYGLIDLAMSLDQIGPMAKEVYGAALLLEVISAHSQNDPITVKEKIPSYTKVKPIQKPRIGVVQELEGLVSDKRIVNLIREKAMEFADNMQGKVIELNLSHTKLGVQTYYPLLFVEFFSGTRKFDGRKYAEKIEDTCGEEVLRRIIGGREISKAEYKGAYYRKALRTKNLIKEDFEKAFKNVDVIFVPVTPALPTKITEKLAVEDAYAFDALTVPANLAGVCAGVVNAGEIDGVPVGVQVIAPSFKEDVLVSVMKSLEK
ncbi:aspartyl/glutamyl-tRNA amidotransferase subunit A [Candidatus Woesearchaeota archaeon]|nr:aspartyl/glutamyl-tRNA amidotransferase subunit A [Candidatus Woesearchaeota archaeon]